MPGVRAQPEQDGCWWESGVWPGGGRSFRKSSLQQAFLGFGLAFGAAGR